MTILVVGASGATGKHLVEQLLLAGHKVKAIVRASGKLPESWKSNDRLSVIKGSVLDISKEEMAGHVKDCDAIASCLGHNLTWKGIYGKPQRLVTDAVQLLYHAVEKNGSAKPVRFVLMNTTGNRNRDLPEPRSVGERLVITLLRLLLPPHVDNEKAADYLRTRVGPQDKHMEWVVVRPDTLVDDDQVTDYEVYPSPTRSAIFNAGKTSRINVGHFMAQLITSDEHWNKWKGQMPVVYNKSAD